MNEKAYLEFQAKTPTINLKDNYEWKDNPNYKVMDYTSNGAAALQEAHRQEAAKQQNNFILFAIAGISLIFLLKRW